MFGLLWPRIVLLSFGVRFYNLLQVRYHSFSLHWFLFVYREIFALQFVDLAVFFCSRSSHGIEISILTISPSIDMEGTSWGLIVGISIGVLIGVCLAVSAFICIHFRKRDAKICSTFSRRTSTIPILAVSDSTIGQDSPKHSEANSMSLGTNGRKRKSVASVTGILSYSYRYTAESLPFIYKYFRNV